ncbi:MAG: hypothetical protein CR997_13495 [Acidobacteria bacterium]|nr:MAG: hypothetical protein CR997_13495 [Acidobacteriota bacterium]
MRSNRRCSLRRITAGMLICLAVAFRVYAEDVNRPDLEVKRFANEREKLASHARFLNQATFGATKEAMDDLGDMSYSAWIDQQLNYPVTLQRPLVEELVDINQEDLSSQRLSLWWRNSLNAQDQLRQRVAFALSEILVVSDLTDQTYLQPVGMAEYYDNLARGAFGNFRTLLEDVSKSPVMGMYLSHLRNQREDPLNNTRPDENYAREILQLFSIGLWHLNLDGTHMLDETGKPIPTYNQDVVQEFARVFTGWNLAGVTHWDYYPWEVFIYLPMEPYNNPHPWEREGGYHDRGEKHLLAYPVEGVSPDHWPRAVLPALVEGEDAQTDLTRALDNIFYHPSVGPFICKQLIQRLVTSNPTPAYVRRVASIFNDNGYGVRGDMFAVVRAILLDREARHGHLTRPSTYGKLREPLIRMAHFWRAFHAQPKGGGLGPNIYTNYWTDQGPMRSPSVFNFFRPDYQPPGEITQMGLVAPEFQITNETFINRTANLMLYLLYVGYPDSPHADESTMVLDFDRELALASEPDQLIDHLDLLFMAGQMSQELKSDLVALVETIDMENFLEGSQQEGLLRVFMAVYLVITSPEYVVQR